MEKYFLGKMNFWGKIISREKSGYFEKLFLGKKGFFVKIVGSKRK